MKRITKNWKAIVIAIAIVLLNLLFTIQVTGTSYVSFSWQNYANAYVYLPLVIRGR